METLFGRSNPAELNLDRKWALHKMYRMQQVHHGMAMSVAGSLLPYIIPISEGIVTVGLFGVIRYHADFHPFITIIAAAVASFATIALGLTLQLAQSTIDNSKTYKDLYKQSLGGRVDIEQYRFKSYRPLEWVVGDMFRIERDAFPNIMQNVVMDSVVNLLVYSKSS